MQQALALPDGCPAATAGVVLPGGRKAAIGLANGDVYKWDMRDGNTYEKMFSGYSRISAIDVLDGTLLVGARDGPLLTIDADSYRKETLRGWSQSESSRIWRCAWLNDGRAVMTSTYGGIHVYERGDGGAWESSTLHGGHVHSVLAVDSREDLLATGDWTGKIVVWERRNGSYSAASSMRGMSGAVGALAWVDGRTLAGIDENGLIRQFEAEPSGRWATTCELDVAVGRGTSMHLAGDKRTLLASTEAEVVQVDLETLRYSVHLLEGAAGIRSEGDAACIIARNGAYTLPIGAVEEPPGTAECRRINASLVGRAGVGKSTLCSTMARTAGAGHAKAEAIRPASERRAWPLEIGGGGEKGARQVMLHDHGGQASVPPAFPPSTEDSDVVLALFKQADQSTFDAACKGLRGLRTGRRDGAARRFLVATHADGGRGNAADGDLRRAVGDGVADGILRIDARTEDGAKEVRDLFCDARLWSSAGRVVKSGRIRAVEAALDHWKGAGDRPVLGLDDIKSASGGPARASVPEAHLDLLLKGMDRRGLLTYYGETRQVVLDDADHDCVRSGIPMLAERCDGIVEEGRIEQEYGASRYAGPVLSALEAGGAFVKCRDRLVFPHLLRDGAVEVPDWFKERFDLPMFKGTLAFGAEGIDAGALIRAAAGLNLPCVDATRTGALFASEGGAGLHYIVSPAAGPTGGARTEIAYRVGGTRRVFCEALAEEFAILARRIGGPEVPQRRTRAATAGAQ